MSQSLPIQTIDFTNHLGHVIKPGDKVVSIAWGHNKSLKIREAEYIGCRVSGSKVQSVTVRAKFTASRYNHNTGRYETIEKIRLSTLPNCRIYPIGVSK